MTYELRLCAGYRHIIDCQAEACVGKVSRKVIRELQKCKRNSNMMQTATDSGLDNLWDEVCVQVQREYSAVWDVYEDFILSSIIKALKENCSTSEIQMIWLQTEAFDTWSDCEFESEDELDACFDKNNFPNEYNIDDVAAHILKEVLNLATDYHNRRIEKYLF